MAADLLLLQLRQDLPLPPDGVLYFTQSLTHPSIHIRKVGGSVGGGFVGGSVGGCVCHRVPLWPPGGDLGHSCDPEAAEAADQEGGGEAVGHQ